MTIRRLAGSALIVFGALNILNFYSPRPIPTVGPQAFVIGGLFVVLGILVRNGFNLPSFFGSRKQSEYDSLSGKPRRPDPLLAVRTLRLAAESKGTLTVAQTAIELNVSLDEAENALEECVRKGSAFKNVSDPSGIARYDFPEFSGRAKQQKE